MVLGFRVYGCALRACLTLEFEGSGVVCTGGLRIWGFEVNKVRFTLNPKP